MPSELLINPATKKALDLFIRRPNSPLMLVGPEGSGKLILSKRVAGKLLNLEKPEGLNSHPYFLHIKKLDGKQDISIDQVRKVTKFLKLKTSGKEKIKRVIIISDAQNMNTEAQNALLKALEEPSPDSLFILTITTIGNIAPTVVSRCQLVDLRPVSLDQSFTFFADKYTQTDIELNWHLSKGSVGLLFALLNSNLEHPLKIAVGQSKKLLGLSRYERLVELGKIATDKHEYGLLLDALGLVLDALHTGSISKDESFQSKFLDSRKLILELKDKLSANCSLKLINDELSLKLVV